MSSKGVSSPNPPTAAPMTTTTSSIGSLNPSTNNSNNNNNNNNNPLSPSQQQQQQQIPSHLYATTPFLYGYSQVVSQPQAIPSSSASNPSPLSQYSTQTTPTSTSPSNYYLLANSNVGSSSPLSNIPSSYSTHVTPTEVATPLPLTEGDAQFLHHINSYSARILQQDPCPVLRQCLVCARGPPQCLVRTPTWATIMRIVLYTLKFDMPSRDFFNLRTDVYGFMLHHWDKICLQKKQTEYWHKQIQDVLSHNKELFESGMELYKQNGYWRLRMLDDPWVLLKRSVPRTRKRSVDVDTIKEMSEKQIDEKEKTNSTSKTQPKGKRATAGSLAWTPKVEPDSNTNNLGPISSPILNSSGGSISLSSSTSSLQTNNPSSESSIQNATSSISISTQSSIPSPSYYHYTSTPTANPMFQHTLSQPSLAGTQAPVLSYLPQKSHTSMYLPAHSYPPAYSPHFHSMQPKMYPVHPGFPNHSYMIPSYPFPVCVGDGVPLSIHPEMSAYQWEELSNYSHQLQNMTNGNANANANANANNNTYTNHNTYNNNSNNNNNNTTTNSSTTTTPTSTSTSLTATQHPLNSQQSEWDQKEVSPYFE